MRDFLDELLDELHELLVVFAERVMLLRIDDHVGEAVAEL
jgi:hypothetical protein